VILSENKCLILGRIVDGSDEYALADGTSFRLDRNQIKFTAWRHWITQGAEDPMHKIIPNQLYVVSPYGTI
jgi:hypothetical protein